MDYDTRSRRRLDPVQRYRSQNFRYQFAQDLQDYPFAPKILCEGDSWFGYPKKDLLDYIREAGAFNMLRMEKAGDELLQDMLGTEQRARLERALDRWNFDLVLFSGGGNDIIGDNFRHYIHGNGDPADPSSFVTARFDDTLARLEAGIREIAAMIDCPIVLHGYDYVYPTGVRF
ncbi:MAG: hypothetical protein AAGE01_07815, partial [Pseudomonadota bacterium]